MKKICFLIVLTQFAYPAFENSFKFQYFGSTLLTNQNSTQSYKSNNSVAFILPFGQPFLKLATLNYSHPFSFGNYAFYMASSGDKLYHEFMTENKFEYLLRHNYNLAVLLNTYLISIENYSTYYTFSSGFRIKYSNPTRFSYFIEYKNGYFITQSKLNHDIPEIIHISIFHENKQNQFVFSIVKDMLYPVDFKIYWRNALHPNWAINFGFINSSREIIGGCNILIGKVSPEIFILHHPNLGMTYGFKIYL